MAGDKLADYWVQVFQEAHGFKPMFERKDGVLLHRLLNHYGNRWAMAWAIREFHDAEDDWVRQNGWSVGAFKARYQGLHSRYLEEKNVHDHHEAQDATDAAGFQLELGMSEGAKVIPINSLVRQMPRAQGE